MKLTDLPTAEDVLARQLAADPEFRAEWERTAVARDIATRIVAYRVEQGLSQLRLARRLGISQPAVARLELGEHVPTLSTLERLARVLGIEFRIEIGRIVSVSTHTMGMARVSPIATGDAGEAALEPRFERWRPRPPFFCKSAA